MANAIETTIRINDNMSKAFRNVTSAVNILISSMENLNRSSENAIDTRSLEAARRSITSAEAAFGGVQDEIDKAQQSQKQFNDEVHDGENAAQKLKAAFSDIVKTTAKVAAGATIAAGTAVGAIVSKSVSAYADYEQLKGGIETIFGAGGRSLEEYAASVGKSTAEASTAYNNLITSQTTVMNSANEAFKTAGISANDYMETVTGFSASLLQSLGNDTLKAAEYSNRAIIDMADNANKMGTDMEAIQNAYQGFAKQNYTMLDNLKLGYGGTKEEMERLIEDASKLTDIQKQLGITVDASSLSFGNIINAISVMQTKMDIAGTTSKEAATTILGSFNSMKAAWENILTTLITGGDNFDTCIDNLVSAVNDFANNITPAIEGALNGLGALIGELAPIIEAELPGIINSLLPSLISATVSMIKGFIKALPDIAKIIIDSLPEIASQIDAGISETFNFDSQGGIFSAMAESISSFTKFLAPITEAMGNFVSKNAGFIPIIVGGVVAFQTLMKAIGGIEKIKGVFSALKGGSSISGGIVETIESIAKMKVTSVAKAVLNIGILTGGITAIVAILAAVAPLIAGLSDFSSLMQLVAAIAAVGAVGSALAAFAGMVGAIPIPAVLLGLANIALVIGGMTAIIVAFAALGQIPGFDDFMQRGGEVLSKLFGTVGEICGSFIGGIGTGITDALPDIAKNITAFVEELKPMFEAVSGVDMTGVSEFFSSVGSFLLQMAGQQFLSVFTGDLNLSGIASQLTSFADESKGFFTAVATFPEAGFTNAALLFQALADIGNVPNSGGLAQLFSGTNDFSGLAEGLKQLSSDSVLNFFTKVANIPETAFANASNFFKALGDISNVPNSGGLAQLFSGTNDFSGLAEGLEQLASAGVIQFFTSVAALPEAGFSKATALFKSLSEISGKQYELNLTGLGIQLNEFGANIQLFMAKINSLETEKLSALSNTLKLLSTTAEQSCTGIKTEFASMAVAINEALILAVTYVKTQGANIKTTLGAITLTQTGKDIIQGLIDGMKSKEDELISYAQKLAQALSNTVNEGLEVGSPSKVMYRTGAFAVEGLTLGIADNLNSVKRAASDFTDAISTTKSDRLKSIYGSVANTAATYTTVRPTINVSVKNDNTINNDVDVSRLARALANGIAQQISLELEGVY